MTEDDERRELLTQLQRLEELMDGTTAQQMMEPFVASGLTVQQIRVLGLVITEPAGGTVQFLAKTLGVALATMSGIVDRLEAHGMIERQIDPSDHRVRRVLATPTGRTTVQEFLSAGRGLRRAALERLSLPDLRALSQGVTALMAVIRDEAEASDFPPR